MKNQHITIIAEAGINHNGSLTIAKELIDVAASAGADYVKFQTFKAENLLVKNAEKAEYQKKNSGEDENQYDMLKKVELSHEDHLQLVDYCSKKSIGFLSTAFDEESLSFLTRTLKLSCLKIASGEITNGPFLLKHAQSGCDLILSTGMSTLLEIEEALGVVAFGLLGKSSPSRQAFRLAYESKEGKQLLQDKVTLLHCTTNYPVQYEDINLKAMCTLHERFFGIKVGYSDHSLGILVALVAVGMGACIIEKHLTLDRHLLGPDQAASLKPEEFSKLTREIRNAEIILGSGIKQPQSSEMLNIAVARKSLVAAGKIQRGEFFNKNNMVAKRPGKGISPMKYWDMLDRASKSDYQPDDLIQFP